MTYTATMRGQVSFGDQHSYSELVLEAGVLKRGGKVSLGGGVCEGSLRTKARLKLHVNDF